MNLTRRRVIQTAAALVPLLGSDDQSSEAGFGDEKEFSQTSTDETTSSTQPPIHDHSTDQEGGSSLYPHELNNIVYADPGDEKSGLVEAKNAVANAGGGIVWMKPGVYEVDPPLNWDEDDVWLWGQGWKTVIRRVDSRGDLIRIDGSGGDRVQNIFFKNFTVDGNRPPGVDDGSVEGGNYLGIAPGSQESKSPGVENSIFSNLYITGAERHGFELRRSKNCLVENTIFDDAGFDDSLAFSVDCDLLTARNCWSINKGSYGKWGPAAFEIEDGAQNCTFDRCIADFSENGSTAPLGTNNGFNIKSHEGFRPVKNATTINCVAIEAPEEGYRYHFESDADDIRDYGSRAINCKQGFQFDGSQSGAEVQSIELNMSKAIGCNKFGFDFQYSSNVLRYLEMNDIIAENNKGAGVVIDNIDRGNLRNPTIRNNGAGLRIDRVADRVEISNPDIYDDQSSRTQKDGVVFKDGNCVLRGGYVDGVFKSRAINTDGDGTNLVRGVSGFDEYIGVESDYAASWAYRIIAGDSSDGAITISLPDVNAHTGEKVTVIKSDTSDNTVTVTTQGSQRIIGQGNRFSLTSQGDALELQAGGPKWFLISEIRHG